MLYSPYLSRLYKIHHTTILLTHRRLFLCGRTVARPRLGGRAALPLTSSSLPLKRRLGGVIKKRGGHRFSMDHAYTRHKTIRLLSLANAKLCHRSCKEHPSRMARHARTTAHRLRRAGCAALNAVPQRAGIAAAALQRRNLHKQYMYTFLQQAYPFGLVHGSPPPTGCTHMPSLPCHFLPLLCHTCLFGHFSVWATATSTQDPSREALPLRAARIIALSRRVTRSTACALQTPAPISTQTRAGCARILLLHAAHSSPPHARSPAYGDLPPRRAVSTPTLPLPPSRRITQAKHRAARRQAWLAGKPSCALLRACHACYYTTPLHLYSAARSLPATTFSAL